eukprot:6203299-Pleurochrysis_carterae.AAC.1
MIRDVHWHTAGSGQYAVVHRSDHLSLGRACRRRMRRRGESEHATRVLSRALKESNILDHPKYNDIVHSTMRVAFMLRTSSILETSRVM